MKLIITIVLGLLHLFLTAQKISFDSMPSLQVLIDSAYANSPVISIKEIEIDKRKAYLSVEKKSWTRSIEFTTKYVAGVNLDGDIAEPYSTGLDQWYGFGGNISLPLSTVVSRKENLKIAYLQIENAEKELERQKQIVKNEVQRVYFELMLNYELTLLRMEAVSMSDFHYAKAKLEFENNTLEITEYSKIHEANVKNHVLLNEAKVFYNAALTELELICGFNIM